MKHCRIALLACLCLLPLAGCGGGNSGGLPGGTGSSNVARMAGNYSFALNSGETVTVAVPGTGTTFSGSGATRASTAYTYTGTLADDGTFHVVVRLGARTVVCNAALGTRVDGTATGSLIVTDSAFTQPYSVTVTRTSALPVAAGPVNSLVAFLDPAATGAQATAGVAVASDGSALYTSAGSSIYRIPLSGSGAATTLNAATGGRLALSGDNSYLYALWNGQLVAVATSGGGATTVANAPATGWITTPRVTAAGTAVFFATATGGSKATMGATPTVTALLDLGNNDPYLGASVSSSGGRLLVATAIGPSNLTPGAASINTASNAFGTEPFQYGVLSSPLPSVAAAAPDAGTLYVATHLTPPTVMAIDISGKSGRSSQSIGLFGTTLSELAVSPDGSHVVAVSGTNPRAFVLDPATLAVQQAIDITVPDGTVTNGRMQIAFSPDSKKAYISGQNKIAVLRLE